MRRWSGGVEDVLGGRTRFRILWARGRSLRRGVDRGEGDDGILAGLGIPGEILARTQGEGPAISHGRSGMRIDTFEAKSGLRPDHRFARCV